MFGTPVAKSMYPAFYGELALHAPLGEFSQIVPVVCGRCRGAAGTLRLKAVQGAAARSSWIWPSPAHTALVIPHVPRTMVPPRGPGTD